MNADAGSALTRGQRRWSARLRRRRRWVVATVAVALLVAVAAAQLVQPRYRASATLLIAGKSLPDDGTETDIRAYAAGALGTRHERVLGAARQANDIFRQRSARPRSRLLGASIDSVSANGTPLLSASFDVSVDAAEPSEAAQAIASLVDLYVEDDRDSSSVLPAVPEALLIARREADRVADRQRDLEAELERLRGEHGPMLRSADDLGLQLAELEAETRSVEARLAELEARRVELDRGLGDRQRGASAYRASQDEPLTSETLAALEAEWIVLRARYGSQNALVLERGETVARLKATANAAFEATAAQLASSRTEYVRLQQRFPIDHPDVVRQAHVVSALESRLDGLRVSALSSNDRSYIESLARERLEIDGEIDGLREQQTELRSRIDEQKTLLTSLPAVRRHVAELETQRDAVRADHATVEEERDALEARYEAVLAERPGRISVTSSPQIRRLFMSRREAIVALGAMLGIITAFLTVLVAERVDARISGGQAIKRLQGHLPLAEIPSIRSV